VTYTEQSMTQEYERKLQSIQVSDAEPYIKQQAIVDLMQKFHPNMAEAMKQLSDSKPDTDDIGGH